MMPIPSDCTPEFETIENQEGDEDGVVLIGVKCAFTPQETRIVYIVFTTNHDVPDAVENRISMWDFGNDEDRVAYRNAIQDLARMHIFPLLSTIPRDMLLWPAGGIGVFTLSTVNGSVQLTPGMLKSMEDMETHWIQALPSIDTVSNHALASIYDIRDIIVVDLLFGGSRDAMLAILRDQPAIRYVTYWIPTPGGCVWSDYDVHMKAILHEMAFLRTIPPHPHIISPPTSYISRLHNSKRVLCGYLIRYYPGGSLGEPERATEPLATRVKWAYQIASGLRHLHHVAHTYHGDIKLDNVVLDENGDAVIIDLEQGRANEGNAAPELHTASLVFVGVDGRLCYSAPHASANSAGDEDESEALLPLRNRDRPYDIWKDTPRAIEAAEAWSFATALQPLLLDVDAAFAMLARCRNEDPNCRPTFMELEEFFLGLHQRQRKPVLAQ